MTNAAEAIRVLIGCESSGVVRRAFRNRGFDAWSCDYLEPEDGDPHHLQQDIHSQLRPGLWDCMIVHPDCTYLCCSGLHWNTRRPEREALSEQALQSVRQLISAPIKYIALENPPGRIGSRIKKASQYIHPYQFGEDASKRTGLWLKNLPLLRPTSFIVPRYVDGLPRWANQTDSGQNRLTPSADRWRERARTYPGIADAMADQWGRYLLKVFSQTPKAFIDR